MVYMPAYTLFSLGTATYTGFKEIKNDNKFNVCMIFEQSVYYLNKFFLCLFVIQRSKCIQIRKVSAETRVRKMLNSKSGVWTLIGEQT